MQKLCCAHQEIIQQHRLARRRIFDNHRVRFCGGQLAESWTPSSSDRSLGIGRGPTQARHSPGTVSYLSYTLGDHKGCAVFSFDEAIRECGVITNKSLSRGINGQHMAQFDIRLLNIQPMSVQVIRHFGE